MFVCLLSGIVTTQSAHMSVNVDTHDAMQVLAGALMSNADYTNADMQEAVLTKVGVFFTVRN
jgi:hypothetical protein